MQSIDGAAPTKDDPNTTVVSTNVTNSSQTNDHTDTNASTLPFNVNINELTLQFETSAITTLSDHTTNNPYAHRQSILNSCRPPIADECQATRINNALAWQRTNRNKLTAKARQIALGELDSSSDDEVEQDHRGSKRGRDGDEDIVMEDRKIRCLDQPAIKKPLNKKPYTKFAQVITSGRGGNQVMYAETMESIPPDLMSDWVMMICPIGKRCLVTSGNGQTVARARSGRIINRFQSSLPNGSINRGKGASSNYCILDCVYDASTWTFYVLDLMCWNGYAIYDCDTDFRHFWLQTKLRDGTLNLYSNTRDDSLHLFKPLIPVSSTEAAQVAKNPKAYMSYHQPSLSYDVDGLLFYHRKTQYITGPTPLVCWLPADRLDLLTQ
ncbi:hypothetical protein BC941DRAFT_426375 [Chlamydoabsidia padenii]|nr:hypothetical protein BC941DRAFT_426375 [Chlamydoabsidia padenii]